jgi:hypothetical protein
VTPDAPSERSKLGQFLRIVGEGRAGRQGARLYADRAGQAPDFYRGLGFAITGQVEDYPRGHSYLTMVKRLRRVPGSDTRDRDPPTRPHLISYYGTTSVLN